MDSSQSSIINYYVVDYYLERPGWPGSKWRAYSGPVK